MSRNAMDTSAVLKLYRAEPNTPLVRACLAPNDELILSEFVAIEVVSASYGLVRQSILTKSKFEADKPKYTILPFEMAALHEAERLLRNYAASISLRPMNAMQLGTALVEHRRNPLNAFITTDRVLISVAQSEGLTTRP